MEEGAMTTGVVTDLKSRLGDDKSEVAGMGGNDLECAVAAGAEGAIDGTIGIDQVHFSAMEIAPEGPAITPCRGGGGGSAADDLWTMNAEIPGVDGA
jgi:hypothetical protein